MAPTGDTTRQSNVARITSFFALIVVIVTFGVLFFRVMAVFLLPLFLAALLVVIFGPAHSWWLRRLGHRPKTAAGITCGLIVLTILLPIAAAVTFAIIEGNDVVSRDWSDIGQRLGGFRKTFGLEMPLAKELTRASSLVDRLVIGDQPTAQSMESTQERLDSLDRLLEQLQDTIRGVGSQPSTPNDILPSRANQADLQLQEMRAVAAELREQLSDLASRPQPASEDDLEHTRELISRLDVRYRRFRQEVLGGPMWAWLVELANPNAGQWRSWRSTLVTYLRSWLLSITGQAGALLGHLLFGLCIMVIAIYYFFLDGPHMIKTLMRLSPIEDRYEEKLVAEFSAVSRAVVVATLLSAVAQGLLAGVGFFFAGASPLFLLVTLSTILAMVPFVGAAAVWLPAALWLIFVENRLGAGIGLAVYGAVVVSLADNIIKPYVLHGQSNIHPLMGLLSVLGGVQVMGPIGILVGPMLVAFLQASLNILRQEMGNLDHGRAKA